MCVFHRILEFSINYSAMHTCGIFYTHNKKQRISSKLSVLLACIFINSNTRDSEIVPTCLFTVMLHLLVLPLNLAMQRQVINF
jgi:hypothetical protein